jgi:hypothetical protein
MFKVQTINRSIHVRFKDQETPRSTPWKPLDKSTNANCDGGLLQTGDSCCPDGSNVQCNDVDAKLICKANPVHGKATANSS